MSDIFSAYVVTTPPAIEPVGISAALKRLRMDDMSDADTVQDLLVAARVLCERFTSRAFIATQYTLFAPAWLPDDIPNLPNLQNFYSIYLPAAYNNVTFLNYQDLKKYSKMVQEVIFPVAPLLSVDQIGYYDTTNTWETWANPASPATPYYYVDTASTRGKIVLDPNSVWPGTYQRPDAVQIKFTAGYGTTRESVPQLIRAAILMVLGYLYEANDSMTAVAAAKADTDDLLANVPAAKHILESYRANFVN